MDIAFIIFEIRRNPRDVIRLICLFFDIFFLILCNAPFRNERDVSGSFNLSNVAEGRNVATTRVKSGKM